MKKIGRYHCLLAVMLTLVSCDQNANEPADAPTPDGWTDRYDHIIPEEIPDNAIHLIGHDRMLVTAGDPGSFETCTAGWGALGVMWDRPVAVIVVSGDAAAALDSIGRSKALTLSFLTQQHEAALDVCQGETRTADKMEEAGLNPETTPSGLIAFDEARLVIECRKKYVQPLSRQMYAGDDQSDMIATWHGDGRPERVLVIAEITAVWLRR